METGVGIHAVNRADELGRDEFEILFSMASPRRKEKARRYVNREDACRSLVAEALLRAGIRLRTGSDIDCSALRCNEFGKPFFPDAEAHFSLSHSGQWVVCGIDSAEIGVDIEKRHRIDSGIADRFFSAEEKRLIQGKEGEEARSETFFAIWSLKESYVKAIGKGFSSPLDGFACLPPPSLLGTDVGFRTYADNLPRRHFHLVDIHPDYSCAVCLDRKETELNPVFMSPAELIKYLLELPDRR